MGLASTILVSLASAATVRSQRQVAVVNLSNHTGIPKHLASGLLYGIPLAPNQIPAEFYSDFGITYHRGGGTHLPDGAGGRGWVTSLEDYQTRFNSVQSTYNTIRPFGANFSILTTDLWGADGGLSSESPWPGDNGDWSQFDNFLARVITDLKAKGMTAGMTFDIWNEPDLDYAWARSQDQFLQMWGRAYAQIRRELPGMSIVGPSSAGSPGLKSGWWDSFASFVSKNGSWPDQWSWHMEPGDGDLMSTQAGLVALQSKYKIPRGRLNVNEYATQDEMNPVYTAWFISQLERINAYGLRGIWLSAAQVFDMFGGIILKPDAQSDHYSQTSTGYYPTGEFQVYKYYNRNMTGQRIGTLPSSDHSVDVYATLDSSNVLKVLYGSRSTNASSSIKINNLSSIGLPTSGTLQLSIWGFPFPDGMSGEVDKPVYIGTGSQTYSGNSATFAVNPTDGVTAYAFEIHGKQL